MADSIQITPTTQADPSKPVAGEVTNKGGGVSTVNAGDISAPKQQQEQKAPEVPEKFRKADGSLDSAALLASYQALESKQGKPTEQTPVIPQTDVTKALTADEMKGLQDEFARDGKLSDTSYKKMSDKGITKEVADGYIAGQKAIAERYVSTLNDVVGGQDAMTTLLDWAGANLTDAEIQTANAALASGNEAQAKMLLSGLQARRTAAVGNNPSLVKGEGGLGTNGVQPFRSNDELVKAMSDKRYKTDEAYREDVAKRLSVTNV